MKHLCIIGNQFLFQFDTINPSGTCISSVCPSNCLSQCITLFYLVLSYPALSHPVTFHPNPSYPRLLSVFQVGFKLHTWCCSWLTAAQLRPIIILALILTADWRTYVTCLLSFVVTFAELVVTREASRNTGTVGYQTAHFLN